MLNSEQDPFLKNRRTFLPVILFLTTFLLVQLYHLNLTIFGIALSSIFTGLGVWYIIKTSPLSEPFLCLTKLQVDSITTDEFRDLLQPIFRDQGYSVALTNDNNRSADLILRKKGMKALVYIAHQSSKVEKSLITHALQSKSSYRATDVFLITTNYFTKDARKYAKEQLVTLIDRNVLEALFDYSLQKKRSHRFIQRVRTLMFPQETKKE